MNKPCWLPFLLVFVIFNQAYAEMPDSEVIKYKTDCAIVNAKLIITDSVLIQINNPGGEGYTHIEIPYTRTNPITHLSGWIEDEKGTPIRRLKAQDITDASAIEDFSLYQDDCKKEFTLRHNVYPYTIGYTYTTVYKQFLTIDEWSPVIGLSVPTLNAQLVLRIPENYPVHIYENKVDKPEMSNKEGYDYYAWNASYEGKIRKELFCPDINWFLPKVIITPVDFVYGIDGSESDWQAFGNWQYRLIQGLNDLPNEEKFKIISLFFNIKDQRTVVKNLYHYLQDNTRYVNVSIDIGGLKPYPASYVALNKYGDCKALTNYMKTLLDCAGIKSYYTIVYSNTQPVDIIRELPCNQFNHAILTVPLGNDTIWLENTDQINPFGYVGTSLQNREALLVDEQGSRLIRMPSLSKQDVLSGVRMDFTVQPNSESKVLIRLTGRGEWFESLNQINGNFGANDQNIIIHNLLSFSDFQINNWQLVKTHRDTRVMTLLADLDVKNVLQSLDQQNYIQISPSNIPDFRKPNERSLPVKIPYPIYYADTLIYKLPVNTSDITLPQNCSLNTEYGQYQMVSRLENNRVIILKEFYLKPGYYDMEQYRQFYSFISAVKTTEKKEVIIF